MCSGRELIFAFKSRCDEYVGVHAPVPAVATQSVVRARHFHGLSASNACSSVVDGQPPAAAAQSPLAAVASSLSGGSATPLGPATPLGVGAGPSTPPSLLRSELRSPVVVRTMPVQLSPDMSTILSSPSTLSSIDPQQQFVRDSHLGVKPNSERAETHMLVVPKEDNKLFTSPSVPKQDWASSLSSNLRSTPSIVNSSLSQNRSAPATAEVRTNDGGNPWKLNDLSGPGMFSQGPSYSVGVPINDGSQPSQSSLDRISMGVGTSGKTELKEEPLLLSAPSSVKSSREVAGRFKPTQHFILRNENASFIFMRNRIVVAL